MAALRRPIAIRGGAGDQLRHRKASEVKGQRHLGGCTADPESMRQRRHGRRVKRHRDGADHRHERADQARSPLRHQRLVFDHLRGPFGLDIHAASRPPTFRSREILSRLERVEKPSRSSRRVPKPCRPAAILPCDGFQPHGLRLGVRITLRARPIGRVRHAALARPRVSTCRIAAHCHGLDAHLLGNLVLATAERCRYSGEHAPLRRQFKACRCNTLLEFVRWKAGDFYNEETDDSGSIMIWSVQLIRVSIITWL